MTLYLMLSVIISFCPILGPPLQKLKLANQHEIRNMIVFAQLSPLILEGLWENATDLFYSWHFALCVIAQAKELSETEGRASESVCVYECVYFHPKRLRPEGNSSNLLLSHINNET